MRGAVGVGKQNVDRLSYQLAARITELSFELLVDERDRAVRTNNQDAAWQRLRREPEEALRIDTQIAG
jgi:hypothetical protein